VSRFAVNPPPTELVDLPEHVRRDHLAAFLDAAPDAGPVWVFAAGSLIWQPGFAAAEARNGTLNGYARRFSFWTIRTRGAPDNPGLGLALEPDAGACQGKVYRLRAETQAGDLDALWRREMFSNIYVPLWRPVETAAGTVPAICFAGNRAHRNYAGQLPDTETAAIIARAAGDWGPCRDYLDLLLAALAREGLEDPDMVRLRELVDRHDGRNNGRNP